MAEVKDVNGIRVLAARTEAGDPKTLREVGDKLRDRLGSGIIVLAGVDGDKVSLLAVVTPDLTDRYHAGKIVGQVAAVLGGRGGGRADMAQAGATNSAKVGEALHKVL